MGRLFGVDFAPLAIPLERRLQTLAIISHVCNFTINPGIGILVMVYLLFTQLWFVSVGYAIYIYYDVYVIKTPVRGGRRSDIVRYSRLGRYFRDYFPISLVKTADLDPSKNYIMGYHPHGIIGCGAISNFATEATGFSQLYPGIKSHLLTLDTNLGLPFLRAYILFLGIVSVSKESIQWLMTKQGTGNAATIVIGGAAEALDAKPGNYDITLRRRKGFVRMALETGASLVPVYSFGENDLYHQADNPKGSLVRQFQELFKNVVGFSPPLFYGRGVFNYTFGLLPYRTPINTVVGKPIDVPKEPRPSSELVDEYHQKYMDALATLFNDHKTKYGVDKDMFLNFV